MAGGVAGRLRAFLGLDTKEFELGTRRARKDAKALGRDIEGSMTGAMAKMSGMGKAFAVGLAGGVVASALGGMNAGIAETVRGIAQIGDEAKRAGMSLESFQEWKFVAEQNRIGVDAMIDGFKELNLRADEFILTGKGSGAEAFQRLGYSAEDLRKKLEDPSELMLEIIGRMGRLDKAAQIRVFDELLGGAGGERFVELLDQGEGKVRDTIRQFRDLGIAFDAEAIAKAVELSKRFGIIEMQIGTLIRQAVVDLGEDIANLPIISFGDSELRLEDLIALVDRLKADFGDHDLDQDMAETLRGISAMATIAVKDMRALAVAAGDVDGTSELSLLADEMERLIDGYARGEVDANKFSDGISEIRDKAVDAASAVSGVDSIQFETVLWGLEKIGTMLTAIIGLGRQASEAIPGDAGDPVYSGRGDGQAEMERRRADTPSFAPEVSIRPRRQGVNSYGDWIAAQEDAAKPKGGGKKEQVDDYAAATAAIREEIAALEAESVAFLAVSEGGRDYGDAIEYARRRAELMYAAQKAGKKDTPELRAEIDALAQSYVTAGMSAEEAADRLDRIKENGERGADALTGVFMGVLNGADAAKAAVANLLMEMAKIQMQKSLLGLAGGSGFFGWLGGALSLPGNAGGTQSWRGGLTRVNELGGEIMNLPRGTQIIPHDISRRLADGVSTGDGGGILEINVNGAIGNSEIQQMVSTGVARGLKAYDGAMPQRLQQINRQPRFR